MRRSISKKLRFEVFKRDGFVCQYCGSHPPDVILHVDHIHPVKDGGSNDINNLVTACESCNLGKGARSLTSIPESLKDAAKRIQESEDQIVGYQAVIMAQKIRIDNEAWTIVDVMYPGKDTFNKTDFRSIKNFIVKLGFLEVYDAADIAASKGFDSHKRMFSYFCGVCIQKLKDKRT